MQLGSKWVVITGSASGIGEALAKACAARGARLLLADIDAVGLLRVKAEIMRQHPALQCHTLVTDTARESDIHALALQSQELGGADVLINNAGVALVAPLETMRIADAQWLMNINFWGVVHGCKAFLPQMLQRPDAVLVNVSSIFAMVSMPTQSIYNASKAAVRGFGDALREELRGTSVRVLSVHPGGVRTNIANKARVIDVRMLAGSEQEFKDHFLHMARTTPEQAAEIIIKAVESGASRVLVGSDAKVLDLLYRLFPTRVSAWLTRLSAAMRRRAKKSNPAN